MRSVVADTWYLIQTSMDSKLQQQMGTHYIHLKRKLDHLQTKQRKQTRKPHSNSEQQQFYTRIKNLTNKILNKEEIELLHYRLQHSIERPITTYLSNLIIETERAIKLLDTKS